MGEQANEERTSRRDEAGALAAAAGARRASTAA